MRDQRLLGVQFDENGKLANCAFTHCSILDDDSRQGFSDMAQYVLLFIYVNHYLYLIQVK